MMQPILPHISILEQNRSAKIDTKNPPKPIRIHFHSDKNVLKDAAVLASVLDFQSKSFP